MIAIAQSGQTPRPIVAPKTEAELDALTERRDELREQLQALNNQRSDLAYQIARIGSDEALRAGPMSRLRATDQRIAQTEADLAASDEAIASAKARGVGNEESDAQVIHIPEFSRLPRMPGGWATTEPVTWRDRFMDSLETTAPITVATVVLLGALLYWRISRTMKNQFNNLLAMQQSKLEELQRSVDTVAVEVERVSENQRFVTKLVGEKPASRP